jgi:hypothetical protein
MGQYVDTIVEHLAKASLSPPESVYTNKCTTTTTPRDLTNEGTAHFLFVHSQMGFAGGQRRKSRRK